MQIILLISSTNGLCAINPHAPEAERCRYKSCSHCKNLTMWMVCCTTKVKWITRDWCLDNWHHTDWSMKPVWRGHVRSTLWETLLDQTTVIEHLNRHSNDKWLNQWPQMHFNQTWDCRNRTRHKFQATMNELQIALLWQIEIEEYSTYDANSRWKLSHSRMTNPNTADLWSLSTGATIKAHRIDVAPMFPCTVSRGMER